MYQQPKPNTREQQNTQRTIMYYQYDANQPTDETIHTQNNIQQTKHVFTTLPLTTHNQETDKSINKHPTNQQITQLTIKDLANQPT